MSDHPWMTEELELFRDQVQRFVDTEMVPNDERWRQQHRTDREFWLKAGELGLLLTDVPTQYGGGGTDFRFDAIVTEELARAHLSSWGRSVHGILAHYILNHGTESQKHAYLPGLASGELIGAIAMTEPGAGSDLQNVRTAALHDGDHYVINGSKTFITNGSNADLIGLVCKTDPTQRAKGISILLIETAQLAGFSRGEQLDKIGMHGQDTVELFFNDCRVPIGQLLGETEGRGFYQLMHDLPYERTIIMLRAVATAEAIIDETIAYTKERQAFGKPLLDMQNTRFKLAEAKAMARIGRVYVDDCVQRVVDGKLDTIDAAIGKMWTTDMQGKVIDECLQLFGGYGYMMEYPVARAWADARVQRIFGGSNEIMKEIIARSL